ncbi:MAG TPA: hypothetical protein VJO99_23970 [Burkholderiaceae bacterium]|nr:hypothetical protein [Burkholderiaceae bacterium]
MRSKARFLGRAVFGLVAIATLSGIVMLLWNAIIPELFAGARSIDYLHALGLLVLSRILFGGFRGHGGWHWHRHGGPWSAMTPEERERFRHARSWGRHAGRDE